MPWVLLLVLVNLKRTVCTEIYTETEDWPPRFIASIISNIRCYVLIKKINSAQSFDVFFDILRLVNIGSTFRLRDVPFFFFFFFFAVGLNRYFHDITVTSLLSFHLTKTIFALSSIATSTDPLCSFSISFTGFNGRVLPYSTLFHRKISVAAISLSFKECNNWGLVKKLSVMMW